MSLAVPGLVTGIVVAILDYDLTQRGDTPCLWFDDQAEEAVEFHTAIFRNSRVTSVTRYGEAGHEIHGKSGGSIMMVAFSFNGLTFTALNGGPLFSFTEAISFQVHCETQADGLLLGEAL
jgi:predicted 3-demethylubiquinone-9 3-methyltransferase (glyoxalase superfamily)